MTEPVPEPTEEERRMIARIPGAEREQRLRDWPFPVEHDEDDDLTPYDGAEDEVSLLRAEVAALRKEVARLLHHKHDPTWLTRARQAQAERSRYRR